MKSLATTLLLIFLSTPAGADDLLINYQKMKALKKKLAHQLWEVVVKPEPEHRNYNPKFVPERAGQAVLVVLPGVGRRLLVSMDLVKKARTITAVAAAGPTCTVASVRHLPDLSVSLIRCREPLDEAPLTSLAEDSRASKGTLVFSLDKPVKNPNIFHGFLDGPMEPPLVDFQYVGLGGPFSFPLLNAKGELVALTIRRLRLKPSILSMAATCKQLRRAFKLRRRAPEGPTRLRTIKRRPFQY